MTCAGVGTAGSIKTCLAMLCDTSLESQRSSARISWVGPAQGVPVSRIDSAASHAASALSMPLFQEMRISMTPEKVAEVFDLTVPVVDGDDLNFRFELLASGTGEGRRYRCRLYRLECIRVRVRGSETKRGKTWENADYRCWVVDDNLGVDALSYRSLAKARNAAVAILKTQLGL
jgi:hypothetical protein